MNEVTLLLTITTVVFTVLKNCIFVLRLLIEEHPLFPSDQDFSFVFSPTHVVVQELIKYRTIEKQKPFKEERRSFSKFFLEQLDTSPFVLEWMTGFNTVNLHKLYSTLLPVLSLPLRKGAKTSRKRILGTHERLLLILTWMRRLEKKKKKTN